MTRFSLLFLVVYIPSAQLLGMNLECLQTPEETPLRMRPAKKIDLTTTSLTETSLRAVLAMFADESFRASFSPNNASDIFDRNTNFSQESSQGPSELAISTIKKQSSGNALKDRLFDEETTGAAPIHPSWVTTRNVVAQCIEEIADESSARGSLN